jgi:hypothetical protein
VNHALSGETVKTIGMAVLELTFVIPIPTTNKKILNFNVFLKSKLAGFS